MKALLKLVLISNKCQKEIILRYVYTVWHGHAVHGAYSSSLFAQMLRNKPFVGVESQVSMLPLFKVGYILILMPLILDG